MDNFQEICSVPNRTSAGHTLIVVACLRHGHQDGEKLPVNRQTQDRLPRAILHLEKFPELKFKYVEEEQPEEFFIPYVWSLVYHSGVGLYWNPQDVQLFTMDSG
ncbi:hypothetical protein XELAEV_18008459mg [Xenopus laevis]|uniref:Dymeclin n=1 Tax=Xenopus laevis TaxID=8355 RepID=A0A974I5E4_XENLA|nr:hypothetical protein XELAEV_18008459mg [Xenopus laevis]